MLGKRCGGVPNRQAFIERKREKSRVFKTNIPAAERGERENKRIGDQDAARQEWRSRPWRQSYLVANTQAVSPRTRQLETMPDQ